MYQQQAPQDHTMHDSLAQLSRHGKLPYGDMGKLALAISVCNSSCSCYSCRATCIARREQLRLLGNVCAAHARVRALCGFWACSAAQILALLLGVQASAVPDRACLARQPIGCPGGHQLWAMLSGVCL
jgi:hypothetical protein